MIDPALRSFLLLFLSAVISCTTPTPYQDRAGKSPAGISFSQLSKHIFQLDLNVSPDTSRTRVMAYFLIKIAELCNGKGFRFYDFAYTGPQTKKYEFNSYWLNYKGFGFCYRNKRRMALNVSFEQKSNEPPVIIEKVYSSNSQLKSGDQVVEINGTKIVSLLQLKLVVHKIAFQDEETRDSLRIKISRGGAASDH